MYVFLFSKLQLFRQKSTTHKGFKIWWTLFRIFKGKSTKFIPNSALTYICRGLLDKVFSDIFSDLKMGCRAI
jgi:hypothetical protein